MRWILFLVSIAVLAGSGCLSSPSFPAAPLGDPALGQVTFSCLPVRPWQPTEGVCSSTLLGPEHTRVEPYVAVHPQNPDVWLVGFNANGPAVEDDDAPPSGGVPDPLGLMAPEPVPPGPPCGGATLCFHLTEDGGTSWRTFALPTIGKAHATHDPVAVITASGVLVAGGLFHHEDNGTAVGQLALLRSMDLGRTWSAPVLVDLEQGPDRPWLSLLDSGRMVLVWMKARGNSLMQAAWSDDAGASWSAVDPPGCKWPSRAVDLGGGRWSVACSRGERDYRVDVLTFDGGERVDRAGVADFAATWPFLAVAADGRRVLVAERFGQQNVVVVETGDGWSKALEWSSRSAFVGDWAWSHVTAAAADGHGAVHVLVVGGDGDRCDDAFCADSARNRQTVHVVLDAANGGFVAERALTPADGTVRPDTGNERGGGFQDDFHSVVPLGDRLLVAWSHDLRVEMSLVR